MSNTCWICGAPIGKGETVCNDCNKGPSLR